MVGDEVVSHRYVFARWRVPTSGLGAGSRVGRDDHQEARNDCHRSDGPTPISAGHQHPGHGCGRTTSLAGPDLGAAGVVDGIALGDFGVVGL